MNTKESIIQLLIKQCRYNYAGKLERAEGGAKMCEALRELFADDLRESELRGRNAGKN